MLNVTTNNFNANDYVSEDPYINCEADILLADCAYAAMKRFYDLELAIIYSGKKHLLSMFKGAERVITFYSQFMTEIYANCARHGKSLIAADVETLNNLTDWEALTKEHIGLDHKSIDVVLASIEEMKQPAPF